MSHPSVVVEGVNKMAVDVCLKIDDGEYRVVHVFAHYTYCAYIHTVHIYILNAYIHT